MLVSRIMMLEPVNITLWGKKDFIKNDRMGEIILDYPYRPDVTTGDLTSERGW